MTQPKMNFTNISINEFIQNIINYKNVDEILDKCELQTEKGFVFERLFDIVIKFGFCDIFTNSNFIHLIGNSNLARLKQLDNIYKYLTNNVISGNSSGCSDITLQNRHDNTYIFITSKYPKTDDDIRTQKNVSYYNIQNIIAMADKYSNFYTKYKIYLLVPNKYNVLDKVKKASKSSAYITDHIIEDCILDKNDLNKYFIAFKNSIVSNINANWNELYLTEKDNLRLRFHQELIIQKTCDLIGFMPIQSVSKCKSNELSNTQTNISETKLSNSKDELFSPTINKSINKLSNSKNKLFSPTINKTTNKLQNSNDELFSPTINKLSNSKDELFSPTINKSTNKLQNSNDELFSPIINKSTNKLQNSNDELFSPIIKKSTNKLSNKKNKSVCLNKISFLWGCKCRSGKTFMIGGIIVKLFNMIHKLNVLIITPAPSETSPQFTNDLFNKYRDFNKFRIHNIESSAQLDKIIIGDNNIFIISKQLLQKHIDKDNIIIDIKNLNLDVIVFDENHFGGTTDLSKKILESYSYVNTIKIYLTATYNKPLKEWNIPIECQMFWDIEDEQICKSIITHIDNSHNCNIHDIIKQLNEKHGHEYITKTINYFYELGYSLDEIFRCYEKMPDMHLITNMFDSQKYELLKATTKTENKTGFCFDSLFSLHNDKKRFKFENSVAVFLRYISGSFKQHDGDKMIFTRIENICTSHNTRKPFTQIWFLPTTHINEISKCLINLMKEDNILKHYHVLCINRKNTLLAKDIKEDITRKEFEATKEGKRGLILLAGTMLSLGITLNLCDVVILMNDTLSSDKVFQQMYRCMTEDDNKKIGFVVDLNISRVLYTCVSYTTHNNLSIDDNITYLVNNRLINIDSDLMVNKSLDNDILIKKLINIWKNDPINSFRELLKKIEHDIDEFDSNTQRSINETFIKSVKGEQAGYVLRDDNDDIQQLSTGIEIIKIHNSSCDNSNDNINDDTDECIDDNNTQKTHISFTKDVLPFVIPLTCILTIKDNNMNFIKILNHIKETPELLEIFNEQCFIWWNNKNVIELIRQIVSIYFNKGTNTFNTTIQFKLSIQSLIDKPKELLELINDYLKPKDVEKKQFGEVFTPMALVNEMLDKLPIDVWSNKNLKWFDPCCGMGNFPVAIYLRLMEGLKHKIKNIQNRKTHILQNMLYMSELNKKNVFICKQIFDIQNKYNLNIYQGDTLQLDIKKIFNVDKFDIIVGNPPYQEVS